MSDSSAIAPSSGWEDLLALVRVLRGPEGCPWDRSQSARELAGHLVEESFEVLEALGRESGESTASAEEELGDVCFLVALVQAALEEGGGSSSAEILRRTNEKIIRRHPHVFAHPQQLSLHEATRLWEETKRSEQGDAEIAGSPTGPWLAPPAPALPALLQALRLQQRAASVGFDWSEPGPVLEKVREETCELEEAMARGNTEGRARIAEELGDLLFSVVNLSRLLGTDPEQVLRAANRKFRHRFNLMANKASIAGERFESLSLDEMDRYWEMAKANETPTQD